MFVIEKGKGVEKRSGAEITKYLGDQGSFSQCIIIPSKVSTEVTPDAPYLVFPFPHLSSADLDSSSHFQSCLQSLPHLQVPMTTNTTNVAHSFSLSTCLQSALNLLHLPCIFCDIPVTHAPAHNLYSCCHFWVISGLSDRNHCSCSCPLHIVRKHSRNKNTKKYTHKKALQLAFVHYFSCLVNYKQFFPQSRRRYLMHNLRSPARARGHLGMKRSEKKGEIPKRRNST